MKTRSIWRYALQLATLLAVAMAFTRPAYAETDNRAMVLLYMSNAISFKKTADRFFNLGKYADACSTYKQSLDSLHTAWSYRQEVNADPNSWENQSGQAHDDSDDGTAAIYKKMTAACNKADEPPPFDHVAALKDLQDTLNALDNLSTSTANNYKLGAIKGSHGCMSAEAVANVYVTTKLNVHTYLEKTTQAEADKAQINILQIDTNAMRAAKDRDEVYCLAPTATPPPAIAPGVLPEQTAFVTLVAEMHLENGLPSKLNSARAEALYNSCYTDNLEAMKTRGSYWGKIIATGCGALYAPFLGAQNLSCPAIADGQKLLLSYGDAPFVEPSMPLMVQIYAQMKTAFNCPDQVVTKSASGIMAIDGKDYIIVKPYPMRPVKAP